MDKYLYDLKGVRNSGMLMLNANTSIASDASVGTDNNPLLGTWTHPATGVYRFKTKDLVLAKAIASAGTIGVFATPTFEAATPVDLVPQIKAKSVSAGVLTVDVVLMTGGTATDPAAACALNLLLFIKDSQALP